MLAVEALAKSYGAVPALAPTTLEFAPARTTAVVGPSGCGKTTLLRLILGLIPADRGTVRLNGATLTSENADALRHRIGYVIQEGGLFPHLTARGNVTLLARHLRHPPAAIEARVAQLCELTRLPPAVLERYPRDLSGGQRQRVALMRALMLDPAVLLFDEPLGALDPVTRYSLQRELKEIFRALGKTVVLVTHDMHEAAWFADEIVLMRDGQIVQRGALDDLLRRPAQPFVTEFIRAQRVDARLAAG